MTSFQWFMFVVAFAKLVPLSLVSYSVMSRRVVVGRPHLSGPPGIQSKTLLETDDGDYIYIK